MEKLKNKLKNVKGITLISLVITVIILLILAGITISQLSGNGIFVRAKEARDKWQNAQNEEEMQIAKYSNEIEKIIGANRNIQESSIIDSFTPQIIEETGNALVVKANATTNDGSIIKGYVFFLNNKVITARNTEYYTYSGLQTGSNFAISIAAIDENGNIKMSTTVNQQMSSNVKTRYLIVDVFDSLNDEAAALNELEVYNSNNTKISYSFESEYDSLCDGISSDWNISNHWSKDNLCDGEISYDNNYPIGCNNCTWFFGGNDTAIEEPYARFIIDIGTYQEIGKVKIAIGDDCDHRTPRAVSVYSIPSYNYTLERGENSIYYKNLLFRSNENISLKNKKEFSEYVTTTTWYEF